MIAKLMELLERYVVAHELIAQTMAKGVVNVRGHITITDQGKLDRQY